MHTRVKAYLVVGNVVVATQSLHNLYVLSELNDPRSKQCRMLVIDPSLFRIVLPGLNELVTCLRFLWCVFWLRELFVEHVKFFKMFATSSNLPLYDSGIVFLQEDCLFPTSAGLVWEFVNDSLDDKWNNSGVISDMFWYNWMMASFWSTQIKSVWSCGKLCGCQCPWL